MHYNRLVRAVPYSEPPLQLLAALTSIRIIPGMQPQREVNILILVS